MAQGRRSDQELLRAARSGDSSAYAALLYRYGGPVRTAVEDAPDPTSTLTQVFVDGMRELRRREPRGPALPWLLGLAERRLGRPVHDAHADAGRMDPDERDAVWAELRERWPNGRRAYHPPRWLGWLALVAALVGIGALVPYLVLEKPWVEESTEVPEPEVVAEPVGDDALPDPPGSGTGGAAPVPEDTADAASSPSAGSYAPPPPAITTPRASVAPAPRPPR